MFHWNSLRKFHFPRQYQLILSIFYPIYTYKKQHKIGTQPKWDVSERSQSDLHWERLLRKISKEMALLRRLTKYVIYVTSLSRPQHISKKISIPWRLQNVSKPPRASICDFSNIPRGVATGTSSVAFKVLIIKS